MSYQDENARIISKWVEDGWEWGKPVSHEVYLAALAGDWDVLLTPTKPVPHGWFGDLKGKKVLGLASGGAQQMPVFAALGAECTVLDYTPVQLESERVFAEREGYPITLIRADMTKPLPFADECFDLIFHPVSNCYVEEVKPIFRECYRILRKGGVLLCGLDNGINYVFNDEETELTDTLPFNPLRNEAQLKRLHVEENGYQFSHTFEEQIGGQLESGFRLTHVYEDTNGSGNLHEHGVPSFWATRAVKD